MKKLFLVKLFLYFNASLIALSSLSGQPSFAQSSGTASRKTALTKAQAEVVVARDAYYRDRQISPQDKVVDRRSDSPALRYLNAIAARNQQLAKFYQVGSTNSQHIELQEQINNATGKIRRLEALYEAGAIAHIEVLSVVQNCESLLEQERRLILADAGDRSVSKKWKQLAALELQLPLAEASYLRMKQLADEGAVSRNSTTDAQNAYQKLKQEYDRLLRRL
jgi:hypothetical protein